MGAIAEMRCCGVGYRRTRLVRGWSLEVCESPSEYAFGWVADPNVAQGRPATSEHQKMGGASQGRGTRGGA